MDFSNCQHIYIGCTYALKNSVSLHKNNLKLPENKTLYLWKYLYEYRIRINTNLLDWLLLLNLYKKISIDLTENKQGLT